MTRPKPKQHYPSCRPPWNTHPWLGPIETAARSKIRKDAEALCAELRARMPHQGPGRPVLEEISDAKARQKFEQLLRQCCKMQIPPPAVMARAFRLTFMSNGAASDTTILRRKQMAEAAALEAENIEFDDKAPSGIKYKVPVRELARNVGVAPKTIREWRARGDYAAAVQTAWVRIAIERHG